MLWHQERVIGRLLGGIIGFYFFGGDKLLLTDAVGPGRSFNGCTGRPYAAAAALEELALLFRGRHPRRLTMNVAPATGPDTKMFYNTVWLGVQNSPNSASFMVARGDRSVSCGRVRLTASLPWSGATRLEVYRNVIPEFFDMSIPPYRSGSGEYDRYRKIYTRRVKVEKNGPERGLLQFESPYQEALLVRACKEGKTFPEPPGERRQREFERPPDFERVSAEVVDEPFGRFCEFVVRVPNNLIAGQSGPYYDVKWDAEATRGKVGSLSHVTPWHAESVYFTPQYSGDLPPTAEGLLFGVGKFGRIPEGAFTFWVYPHVQKGENKDPPEQVHLRVRIGRRIYIATLEPGRWQRVKCETTRKQSLVNPTHIIIKTDRHWEEYQRGARITFEIHGPAVVEYPDKKLFGRFFKGSNKEQLNLVLLGPPGYEAEFHRRFKKSIKIKAVKRLRNDGTTEDSSYSYLPKSQLLELHSLDFPSGNVENLVSQLTPRGAKLCRRQKLKPILLRIELDR